MNGQKKSYVLCISNRGYKASLEVRKIYEVVPDKDASALGLTRVIDESGADYLYQSKLFVAISLPEMAKDLFVHTRQTETMI